MIIYDRRRWHDALDKALTRDAKVRREARRHVSEKYHDLELDHREPAFNETIDAIRRDGGTIEDHGRFMIARWPGYGNNVTIRLPCWRPKPPPTPEEWARQQAEDREANRHGTGRMGPQMRAVLHGEPCTDYTAYYAEFREATGMRDPYVPDESRFRLT